MDLVQGQTTAVDPGDHCPGFLLVRAESAVLTGNNALAAESAVGLTKISFGKTTAAVDQQIGLALIEAQAAALALIGKLCRCPGRMDNIVMMPAPPQKLSS